MLIDLRTASFNEETVTADKAGDVIDMVKGGYIGTGNPVYLCVAVSGMDASDGNETYSVKWEDGTAATEAAGVTTGKADIPGSTLTFDRSKGSEFKFATIQGGENVGRYVQAAANPGGTSPSFKVTAWITGERPEFAPTYADAISFASNT